MIDSGRTSKAKALLEDFGPNKLDADAPVRYCWGYWYEHIGMFDSALVLYDLNLTDPNSNEMMDQLAAGRANYGKGDFQKAFDHFWTVQQSDSCFGDVRYYLGMTLYSLGEKRGASYAYLNQLKCDPLDTTTLHNLGILYGEMGQYEEEVSILRRKLSLHTSDSDMLDLSMGYHHLGNDSDAMRVIDTCDFLYGPSARSLTYRATIWLGIGRTDSALAILTKAVELDSTYNETIGMTQWLFGQGLLPRGGELYRFAEGKR